MVPLLQSFAMRMRWRSGIVPIPQRSALFITPFPPELEMKPELFSTAEGNEV